MKNVLTLERKRNLAGWLFVAPWIIGFVTLMLIPFFQSIVFSFSKLHVVGGGYHLEYRGWENYRYILTEHPDYVRTVVTSIGSMLADVPLILIFSVFAALLVRGKSTGSTIARTIFFMSVIIGAGVVRRLQAQDWLEDVLRAGMVEGEAGGGLRSFALREYLLDSGIGVPLVRYVTSAVDRIQSIIADSGIQILIALAGLHSIPDSFYEAARMEGSTGWEIFWKITFPIISPVLLASGVYTIIDSFTAYDNKAMEMIKTTAFGQSHYGRSAAMSWVYFAIILIVLLLGFLAFRRRIYYRD